MGPCPSNMRLALPLLLLALVAPALSQTLYQGVYSDTSCSTFPGSTPSYVHAVTPDVCTCRATYCTATSCSSPSSHCSLYIKVAISGTTISYNAYGTDSTCTTITDQRTYTDGTCAGTDPYYLWSTNAITGADYTYTCSATECYFAGSSGNGAARVAVSAFCMLFAALFFYLA